VLDRDGQHWRAGAAQDLLRHAAIPDAREPLAAAGAGHDQVDPFLARERRDPAGGYPESKGPVGPDSGGTQPSDEPLELAASADGARPRALGLRCRRARHGLGRHLVHVEQRQAGDMGTREGRRHGERALGAFSEVRGNQDMVEHGSS
jgi:hypothetical protein